MAASASPARLSRCPDSRATPRAQWAIRARCRNHRALGSQQAGLAGLPVGPQPFAENGPPGGVCGSLGQHTKRSLGTRLASAPRDVRRKPGEKCGTALCCPDTPLDLSLQGSDTGYKPFSLSAPGLVARLARMVCACPQSHTRCFPWRQPAWPHARQAPTLGRECAEATGTTVAQGHGWFLGPLSQNVQDRDEQSK